MHTLINTHTHAQTLLTPKTCTLDNSWLYSPSIPHIYLYFRDRLTPAPPNTVSDCVINQSSRQRARTGGGLKREGSILGVNCTCMNASKKNGQGADVKELLQRKMKKLFRSFKDMSKHKVLNVN